jgi:hypothetical protein
MLEHSISSKSVVLQIGVNFTYSIILAWKMYNVKFFATSFAVLVPYKNDNVTNSPCYPRSFFFTYVNIHQINVNAIYSKESK